MNNYLNDKAIIENKSFIIEKLNLIKRSGADIPKLIAKLESSDFFTAPASTAYRPLY